MDYFERAGMHVSSEEEKYSRPIEERKVDQCKLRDIVGATRSDSDNVEKDHGSWDRRVPVKLVHLAEEYAKQHKRNRCPKELTWAGVPVLN